MQPKKHYFAHIPTIAIFIVFAMSAPLGVLLFILKSIDKNAEKRRKSRSTGAGRLSFRPRPPPLRRRHPGRIPRPPAALTAPPQNRRALKTGTRPLP